MERLPGLRDFYPEPIPHPDLWSADARQFIFEKWRATARRYGFREYDGPPLEPLELFTTKSGDEIVGQLYNFTDKGERTVALRPEMTPTLARTILTSRGGMQDSFGRVRKIDGGEDRFHWTWTERRSKSSGFSSVETANLATVETSQKTS